MSIVVGVVDEEIKLYVYLIKKKSSIFQWYRFCEFKVNFRDDFIIICLLFVYKEIFFGSSLDLLQILFCDNKSCEFGLRMREMKESLSMIEELIFFERDQVVKGESMLIEFLNFFFSVFEFENGIIKLLYLLFFVRLDFKCSDSDFKKRQRNLLVDDVEYKEL